jgi:hypothetical protein
MNQKVKDQLSGRPGGSGREKLLAETAHQNDIKREYKSTLAHWELLNKCYSTDSKASRHSICNSQGLYDICQKAEPYVVFRFQSSKLHKGKGNLRKYRRLCLCCCTFGTKYLGRGGCYQTLKLQGSWNLVPRSAGRQPLTLTRRMDKCGLAGGMSW